MFSFLEGRVLEQSPDCPVEALADPWAGGIDVPDLSRDMYSRQFGW
jgi:hypothetical protein